jgi:N-acyl-D-amino-acid deacylase
VNRPPSPLRILAGLAILSGVFLGACQPPDAPDRLAPRMAGGEPFDLLIVNARVVDGAGNPWFRADVGIRDDRIVAVGTLGDATAARVIDAGDRVLAPGFIDMMGTNSLPFLTDPPAAEGRLRQGITTMLVGEGGSHAPQNEHTLGEPPLVDGEPVTWRTFDEYHALLENRGIPLNLIHNVGLAQVRRVVLGDEAVQPTPEQMTAMEALVQEAMEQGAVGVSSALIYPPGTYASLEELVQLSSVAARHGGVYFTHIRNESSLLLEALEEALEVGRRAGIPVHIYHLKAAGKENWPLMARAIARIQAARDAGQDVTADIYPYVRNGIGLGSFLHPRHYAAGTEAFLATLDDPAVRRELRREVETTWDWENWYRHVGNDWDAVQITGVGRAGDPALAGLSVAGAATLLGMDVWDGFFHLVKTGGVSVAPLSMNEEQKHLALRAPWVSIDVDTSPANPANATSTHPRAFGAFPRVLAKYVREDGVITLEEAVRKMSSLAANRLGLHDRGRIAPGLLADLVIFDPDLVQDRATFTSPMEMAEGIDFMLVNGVLVIDEGRLTHATPGRILRHGG